MIARYIVLSNIISVVSDSILRRYMYSGTYKKNFKKFIVLLHTLSACNSLLVRFKVYSSDPREFLCTQAKGMVKLMKENFVKIFLKENKL